MSVWERIWSVRSFFLVGTNHLTGRRPANTLLFQRYSIVKVIGKGGMGAVYQAIDLQGGNRLVAIKEMRQTGLSEDDLLTISTQFEQEAEILGKLAHPNLPVVHRSFQDGGRSYLVMDYIDGETLLQMLKRCTGPMPFEQVIHYALQLCNVLRYLHQQRPPVVFRDLKPSNIMIDAQAKVYLVDFGIARLFKAGQAHDTRGYLSPGYAPPEQYGNAQTSPRSDLFSLGATIHQCLTGRDPASNSPSLFAFPPVRAYAPHVPASFEKLIESLVKLDPLERPTNINEVERTLLNIKREVEASVVILQKGSSLVAQNGGQLHLGRHPFGSTPANDEQTIEIGGSSPVITHQSPHQGQILHKAMQTGQIIEKRLKKLVILKPPRPLPQSPAEGVQIVRTAFTTGFPPIWTRPFNIIFIITIALMLSSSVYALTASSGSLRFVSFALALCLCFITLIAATSGGIQKTAPRNLLLVISMIALICCLAFQTDPIIQQATRNVLHDVTMGQFLMFSILALAVVALSRSIFGWRAWLEWADHITLFGLAFSATLLQFSLGSSEPVPFLATATYPLASQVFPDVSVNQLVALGLLLVSIILLCRIVREFTGLDRFLLFTVTLAFVWLQLSLGESEIHALFPQADQQLVPTMNLGVAFGLLILGFAVLFHYTQDWITRTLTLGIVILCILLQRFLEQTASVPVLSANEQQANTQFLQSVLLSQLLTWSLVLASLLLLARLVARSNWIDRVGVFIIALACALLQLSFGEGEGMHVHLGYYNLAQSSFSLPQVVGLNRILVFTLVLAACIVFFRWTHNEFTTKDRIVLPGIPLFSGLLQFFLGTSALSLSNANTDLTIHWLLAGALGLFFLILLFRLKKDFNGWDRFMLVVSAGSCISLAWGNTDVRYLPLLSTSTQQMMDSILALLTQKNLLAFMIIGAAIVSLLWLLRPLPPPDRKVLRFFLLPALLCALLQVVMPFTFPLALVLLLLGAVLATQMERVR